MSERALKEKCVNAARIIAADAIENAGSGHPGICMGAAPAAFVLFADFLNFSYKNPEWDNRDRFVLSAGHGSMLLYTLLYMFGLGVKKEDLLRFRKLGSRTPGHPERGTFAGVETSTGPLGQGIANAVGFAVAEAHLAAAFNRPQFDIVDHYTYVLCGEGCIEEGIGYEACSFAGNQKLGKLILFYDANNITLEGDTETSFTEDIRLRFISQGWQVCEVEDANDLNALKRAVEEAKGDKLRPSVIICRSVIGYGSPVQNTAGVHGTPLGRENLEKTKEFFGWTEEPLELPEDVKEYCRGLSKRKAEAEELWAEKFKEYKEAYPELAEKYKLYMRGGKIAEDGLCAFGKPEATRISGGKVINALAGRLPNLLSGSADLASSTKTDIADGGHFSPENRAGRNIRFGIREHAMSAICNGIALHGGLRVICSTFLAFADYMKGGIRMSAITSAPVIYVFTHDSIGVGEDGATHQPVEQLVSLRSVPNLNVYRPCCGRETEAAFISAVNGDCPSVIALSRQNVKQFECGNGAFKGGYVLADCKKAPDALIIASGSEAGICAEAKDALEKEGIFARVVSMPCIEQFERQPQDYREKILPAGVRARVCVEAGSSYSWYKYAGDCGEVIAMDKFGASAPADELFSLYGFTAENIVNKVKAALKREKKISG